MLLQYEQIGGVFDSLDMAILTLDRGQPGTQLGGVCEHGGKNTACRR